MYLSLLRDFRVKPSFPVDFLHFQAVVGIGTCELRCHSVETGKGCGSNNSHLAEEKSQCSMVNETFFGVKLFMLLWILWILWLVLTGIAVRLSR